MMPVIANLWNPRLMSFSNSKHLMAPTFIALSLLLAGCGNNFGFPGVYRINVEQGNIVTFDMIEQLQPGMTRRQVRFILGTPLIEDTFHPDRWDYRYTLRNGIDTLEENRLTVFFEGDELVNVVGAEVPAWAQPHGSTDADDGTS
jgi:outer membrane protein assembly factor BamE